LETPRSARGCEEYVPSPPPCSFLSSPPSPPPLPQIDHQASYVAEVKEYEAEKEEVADSQGEAFPYSSGIWLISQLVSAINPSDLDLLDEGYPLTKYSLDNLLGRVHTPQVPPPLPLLTSPIRSPPPPSLSLSFRQEYQNYFLRYPLCGHYVEAYPQLLSEPVGIESIPSASNPQPFGGDESSLAQRIQPITSLAWKTMVPKAEE
jgi:hypothetical protein